jgi:hypothetical protein
MTRELAAILARHYDALWRRAKDEEPAYCAADDALMHLLDRVVEVYGLRMVAILDLAA